MTKAVTDPRPLTSPTATAADGFDLDITVLESDGEAAALINLTDDGCGSSCPDACATNVA